MTTEELTPVPADEPAQAPAAEQPAAQPAAPAQPQQNQAPQFDPRRRMRELLSIPDRDRTDAEWDELNELEIQMAPGNRVSGAPPIGAPMPGGGKPHGQNKQRQNKGGGGGGGGGGGQHMRRPKGPKKKPQPGGAG